MRGDSARSAGWAPQVAGAVRDTVAYAKSVAIRELAAAIDNPVVLPDGEVTSNGNFHGAPVAYVLDFLAIEYISAARCIELRAPLRPAPKTADALAALRRVVPGHGPDRFLAPELEAAASLLA